MRLVHASILAVALLLSTSRASADEPAAPPGGEPITTPISLRHDTVDDLVATGVLTGSLVLWTVSKSNVLPSTCVICDEPGNVNGVDDFFRTAFRRSDGDAARTAADVTTYGVAPAMGLVLTLGAAAADRRTSEAPLNALLVAEASLAAIAANEAVGAVIRRPRPLVRSENDAVASFPSGSAASIMAITASSATIASLRGYRLAPLIWIVGTTVGLTATYFQMAADRSYFTDNLAGAAIGLGFGTLVPLVFHGRVGGSPVSSLRWLEGATLTSTAVPGGRTVSLGWSL